MIRTVLLVALAAFSIAFAKPAMARVDPTEFAGELAVALRELVGQKFEGGITISDVTAEGSTVVILFGGDDGWRQDLTRQEVTDAFIVGFCGEAGPIFSTGIAIRVDSIDAGDRQQGDLIRSCPTS